MLNCEHNWLEPGIIGSSLLWNTDDIFCVDFLDSQKAYDPLDHYYLTAKDYSELGVTSSY